MFRKIALAYNESPEAQRALISAIELAKSLKAELHTVTVMTALPAYTAYVAAVDASLSRLLMDDRARFYETLLKKASALANQHDIELTYHLVEGSEVDAIVNFVREQKTDLLMLGLYQRDFYVARLWSTVYELAQEAPCSVLGVH
jgi:nucleotide-binding universal stress UspA family protein